MDNKTYKFEPWTAWQKEQMEKFFDNYQFSKQHEELSEEDGEMSCSDGIYLLDKNALDSLVFYFDETLREELDDYDADALLEKIIIWDNIDVIVQDLKKLYS